MSLLGKFTTVTDGTKNAKFVHNGYEDKTGGNLFNNDKGLLTLEKSYKGGDELATDIVIKILSGSETIEQVSKQKFMTVQQLKLAIRTKLKIIISSNLYRVEPNALLNFMDHAYFWVPLLQTYKKSEFNDKSLSSVIMSMLVSLPETERKRLLNQIKDKFDI